MNCLTLALSSFFDRAPVTPHISVSLSGYIEAVVIPAGARRIKVVEDKPSHSFLGNDACVLLAVLKVLENKHC